MTPLVLGVALAALGNGVAGAGLVWRRRAIASGVLLVLGSALVLPTAWVLRGGAQTLAGALGTAGAGLGAIAITVFPVPRVRHPLDVAALVVVILAGAIATAQMAGGQTGPASVTWFVEGCAVVAHTWWRIEVERGDRRRAVVWMALALSIASLVFFFVSFAFDGAEFGRTSLATIAVFGLVGAGMYVGATTPEVVDVRGLVVGAVVTAAALGIVLATFVLEVGLLESLGAREPSVGTLGLLAALAAIAYHPARSSLRGVVDQLLFGDRPDPLGAASAVAGRIGEDPAVALRAIREALVLPYAAVLVDGEPVAESGIATTHRWNRDLDGAGTLVLGLRPGDLAFSPGDDQVLRLVIPLLAQTLRARALTQQVLDSRGQTIAAIEEERRRLRRDLHDGLGPRLSGVAFTSDAVRNLLHSDPTAAEGLLVQLRADTVTAIEEIRQLVYAMRPPALDELGLMPALRQQTNHLRNQSGQAVLVDIAAPESLPHLSAAVEVAAYRIVTEALTNVARHTTSLSASVRLTCSDAALCIEVSDVGHGKDWRPGVGLSSMRERAAELGGTLDAGPGIDGGRVVALLPL